MVWMKKRSGMTKGRLYIWADGYVPNVRSLKRRWNHSGYGTQIVGVPDATDALFPLLVYKTIEDYCRKHGSRSDSLHCDHFPMNFKNLPVSPSLDPEFYEEFLNDPRKETYRQVMFSVDENTCHQGVKCMENVMGRVGMRIKEPGEYRNFEAFVRSVHQILERLEGIYERPNELTSELMKELGFDELSDW